MPPPPHHPSTQSPSNALFFWMQSLFTLLSEIKEKRNFTQCKDVIDFRSACLNNINWLYHSFSWMYCICNEMRSMQGLKGLRGKFGPNFVFNVVRMKLNLHSAYGFTLYIGLYINRYLQFMLRNLHCLHRRGAALDGK